MQLALPVDRVRTLALDAAVDEVRDKFGSKLLTRGVLLGRDPRDRDAACCRTIEDRSWPQSSVACRP